MSSKFSHFLHEIFPIPSTFFFILIIKSETSGTQKKKEDEKIILSTNYFVFTSSCGGHGGGACGMRSGSMGVAGGGAVQGHQSYEQR
jgi:hypothetical protein